MGNGDVDVDEDEDGNLLVGGGGIGDGELLDGGDSGGDGVICLILVTVVLWPGTTVRTAPLRRQQALVAQRTSTGAWLAVTPRARSVIAASCARVLLPLVTRAVSALPCRGCMWVYTAELSPQSWRDERAVVSRPGQLLHARVRFNG